MIEMLGDLGDGVLHRFGWFGAATARPFAACRMGGASRPSIVYLERDAPDGAALCPWCMDDVLAPRRRARETAPRSGRIENRELRRAFRRSGASAAEVAARIGWTRVHRGAVGPDGSRVRRALGIAATDGVTQWTVSAEVALLLAAALSLDPVDVGL